MERSEAFREDVYRAYMEFFELAEKKRRWNVFNDIPWDELDPSKNDHDAALLAETFCGVEMYLPDYVSQGMNVVRDYFGAAWFSANWGYEESKHAFALREYLSRSGQRTLEEMRAFEKAILGKRWELPFSTARQMTFYGTIQEAATFMIYKHQLARAKERGDTVLATIYGLISRDEAAHADFYRKVTQLELVEHRADTVSDMAFVFRHFQMPGLSLVPNYDERTELMRQHSGVDRGTFLSEVWFPTLKKLGVNREELTEASARQRAAEAVRRKAEATDEQRAPPV